ncbi:MAG: response regulator, partial [Acidobacteria bacterium]|nr:response regulator [Acidobacteriota bacterium]
MNGTVLVIDDEANLREVLRIVLEGEGLHVVEADSIAAATSLIETRTFDLVLCDIFLPDGNGLDLVKASHATHP